LLITTARQQGPVAKSNSRATISNQEIFDLYRAIGRKESVSLLRREKIIQIPEEKQLAIVWDDSFHSVKDSRGVGLIHDLAMYGTVRTQVEIIVQHAKFDTPAYNSQWGTPPDLAAILGCFDAKMMMVETFTTAELTKPRLNSRTHLHDIGRSVENRGKLMLVDQVPQKVLGTLAKGVSAARLVHNTGDKAVKRKLYLRNPLWNWYDNPPWNRSANLDTY
jgi:hypothetical protein